MSSAFLYLAIVAIWACVLVPRWLRRDSAVTELAAEGSYDEAGYWEDEEDSAAEEGSTAGEEFVGREMPAAQSPAAEDSTAGPVSRGHEGDHPAVRHADPGQSRRRVLAARRRLLGMLLLLTAGAICLALMGLAAWWVVLPPLLMLAGYLPLLREVARMDAERARHAERAALSEESARSDGSDGYARSEDSGRSRPAGASQPSRGAQPSGAAELSGASEVPQPSQPNGPWHAREASRAPVPPPDAEIIDISAQVGEDFYDQYTDARLRAVGDLRASPAERATTASPAHNTLTRPSADDTSTRRRADGTSTLRRLGIWPKWPSSAPSAASV